MLSGLEHMMYGGVKVSKNEREEEKEPRQIIQDNTSYLINTGYIDFNFLIYF